MKQICIFGLFILSMALSMNVRGQGTSCVTADPFCTGVTYGFPMNTNTSAESGPNYGCLGTQPNPVWYFLLIDDPGNITIHMQSPTGNDIDFAAWGPFGSPTGPCTAQLTANCGGGCCPDNGITSTCCPNNTLDAGFWPCGNMVDCSFDPAYVEDCHISNAVTGQYYMLCITNYSNSPGDIVFSQSNSWEPGAGSTDCSIVTPCNISAATAVPSACNPATNQYTVSGSITFSDAPATGQLTVTDGAGAVQTFNAPFTSPQAYTLTGLVSDGVSHTITIQFTSDQFCSYTVTYSAPPPCNSCTVDAGEPFTQCGLVHSSLAAVSDPTNLSQSWSCPTCPPGVVFSPANSATASVTVPASGIYTFVWTITNQSGLTCSDQIVGTFYQIPTSTFTASSINCFGQNSTVTYTGNATGAAIYAWNFGGGSATGSGQGPYTVNWPTSGLQTISLTVTENGCAGTPTTVNVNNPTDLTFTVDITPPGCAGGTGQATPIVSGGTAPYSFAWSNVTGPPFVPGNYTGTVTDALLCTETYSFTVTAPNNITIVPNQTDVSCFGGNDGTASVTPSGGTAPYTYAWTGGVSTTNTASNLTAGTYTITITDDNACSVTQVITITEPSQVNVNLVSSVNPTCNGVCNGSASVNASGGTPGYSYVWSNGAVTASVNSLCANVYTVTVTDLEGCTASLSVNLSQPSSVQAVASYVDVSCSGVCDGEATVTVSNGSPPYFYSWSNGIMQATITNLCAGNYTVTVADVNGCTVSASTTVNSPTPVTASVTNTSAVICFGDCDGTATVTAGGGTPPYGYAWSVVGGNQATINTLCAGTHYVTVTDAGGCTATATAMISQPSELDITGIAVTNVSCNGLADGSLNVGITGGIGSYTFQVGTMSDTAGLFTNLPGGLYGVTVTDHNGCTETGSATVNQPGAISLSLTPNQNICNGETAFLTASVTGGTPGYTYIWNGVSGNSVGAYNPTITTTYNVWVVDSRGCYSDTASSTVFVSAPVQLTVTATPANICPGDQVIVTTNVSGGGGPPYTMYYLGNVVVPPLMLNPTATGPIIITVRDGCGSTDTDSALVTVYPLPPVSFTSNITQGCQPLEVNFNVGSTLPGQLYVWDFGDNSYDQISYDQNPTHTFDEDGLFDVSLTITSAEGCDNTFTINDMIRVFPVPDARFSINPTVVSIIKPEVQFINLSTLASYYVWAFGDGDSSSVINPTHWYDFMGDYIVTLIATSSQGCSDTAQGIITVRDEYTFYAPSAFSPDNDGRNDMWFVIGNGILPQDFEMYIYDRWGEIIYETDKYDPENPSRYGWDGYVNGAGKAPVGTYTWLVIYLDGQMTKHQKAGAVTLIR